MFKLLSRLSCLSRLPRLPGLPWRKAPCVVRRRPCGPPPQPQPLDSERTLGCGWFDSSHELEHGLLVREADAQALSALPLALWLDLELRRGDAAALPS